MRLFGASPVLPVFIGLNTVTTPRKSWHLRQPIAFLVLAAIVWLGLYQTLLPGSEALVAALPMDRASHLGGALQFSIYDTPKMLMLPTGMVINVKVVHAGGVPSRDKIGQWLTATA